MANQVILKPGDSGSSPVSGSFYLVAMGPFQYADGSAGVNPNFQDFNLRFGGSCSNELWSVGPGDWLLGKQGNATGPAEAGFETLCGIGNMGGNGEWVCPVPIEARTIKIAMWSVEGQPPGGGCNPRCYRVKYTGVFVVTKYTKDPHAGDGLWGYFSSMSTTGSFTETPGPLKTIALVR